MDDTDILVAGIGSIGGPEDETAIVEEVEEVVTGTRVSPSVSRTISSGSFSAGREDGEEGTNS